MVSISICAMLLMVGTADAWGPDGHTIVAHVADYYLSPDVDAVLRADLDNISLNNISQWCDDFDHSPEGSWSEPLHFIDYPGKACSFDWARDCKNDFCNAGAIVNYTKQIFDPSISKDDRLTALKFVIHMVGDIHQPLHVSSGDDWGGNKITVPTPHFNDSYDSSKSHGTNLHAVWDDAIVVQDIYDIQKASTADWEPTYHNWPVLAKALEQRMAGDWVMNKSAWQATVTGSREESVLRAGLTVVAQETAVRGCKYAYNYADGSAVKIGDVLDRAYYERAQPIIEEQLAKGGVRLAELLKEALAQARLAQVPTISV